MRGTTFSRAALVPSALLWPGLLFPAIVRREGASNDGSIRSRVRAARLLAEVPLRYLKYLHHRRATLFLHAEFGRDEGLRVQMRVGSRPVPRPIYAETSRACRRARCQADLGAAEPSSRSRRSESNDSRPRLAGDVAGRSIRESFPQPTAPMRPRVPLLKAGTDPMGHDFVGDEPVRRVRVRPLTIDEFTRTWRPPPIALNDEAYFAELLRAADVDTPCSNARRVEKRTSGILHTRRSDSRSNVFR